MRLAWLTDPHLDHAPFEQYQRLVGGILAHQPHRLLLTGDISQAEDLTFQLSRLQADLRIPLLFVLGNHDFYGGAISDVRAAVHELASSNDQIIYLSSTAEVPLGSTTAVVGDDGWGDATVGDYERSPVRLSDFHHIADFSAVDPVHWRQLLGQLGRDSADRLEPKLIAASSRFQHVIVLTHVPPFREACWYEGRTTDDLWAPFFVCGAMGEMLRRVARSFPHVRYTVLCGHTHHGGTANIEPNLTVITGASEYGRPRVWDVLEIDDER